ncbi:hypothetical protein T4D_16988 [Trichinella pseudospiralis]|uniref:Uncharacterized protein n=1 Tax=Trichinella pseudospiralis TaxID=6337 RepID=A0A0V1FJC0_TRIPS|nr:hypothetical protein T4D_16988 [Trichinella pseudospiralis]
MPTFLSTMASTCELLIRSTERSSTRFVDDESNLIELLNCYPGLFFENIEVLTFHFYNIAKNLILNVNYISE